MSGPWERFQSSAALSETQPPQPQTGPWTRFQTQSSPADVMSDAAYQVPVGFNKGLNDMLALPGRAVAAGVEALGFPETADKFRWKNNPVSDFLTAGHGPRTTAGRYVEAGSRAIGSAALPSAGMVAAAPAVARAGLAMTPSTMSAGRSALQSAAEQVAATPVSTLALDAASAAGSGIGHEAAKDAGFGPTGQMVGSLLGAFAPAGLAAGTQQLRSTIGRAYANQGENGAYGSFVEDLGRPVSQFADEVAVGATRANTAYNRRTLDILGEEMHHAGGDAAKAQQATIARIAQETGVTRETATQRLRQLTEVHDGSPLVMAEYPAVAQSDVAQRMRRPGNVDLDEVGRVQPAATQGTIDYLANNGNAQSAQVVRQAIADRHDELSPAFWQAVQDMPGVPRIQTGPRSSRAATIIDTEAAIEHARRTAGGEYRAAVANQKPFDLSRVLSIWDRRFHGQQSPLSQQVNRAVDLFRNRIQTVAPTGQPGPVQITTTQELRDFINRRGALNDMIDASRNDRGQATTLTRELVRFKQHIDHVVGRANPQWRVANDRWADMNFDRVAGDLGDALSLKAGGQYRQQIRQFQRMAPEAQDIVRTHFLQKLHDRLDNLRDTHSVSKLFDTDHTRRVVMDLFGADAAIAFTRAIRDQKVAEATKAATGNSRTHLRGMTQRQKDAETGIVTAMGNASVKSLRDWLLERATQMLTERRNRPLADISMTPMIDTARVAQHLHRMRQQEAALRRAAQPGSQLPSIAATPSLVGMIAGRPQ